jgi:hypothetical protein
MFSYVIFVGLLVAIQAALCSTASPPQFSSSSALPGHDEADIDLGGLEDFDKLSHPPVGAIAGMKPHHKFGSQVNGVIKLAQGTTAGTTPATTSTPN